MVPMVLRYLKYSHLIHFANTASSSSVVPHVFNSCDLPNFADFSFPKTLMHLQKHNLRVVLMSRIADPAEWMAFEKRKIICACCLASCSDFQYGYEICFGLPHFCPSIITKLPCDVNLWTVGYMSWIHSNRVHFHMETDLQKIEL